jgi:hypothetical protein
MNNGHQEDLACSIILKTTGISRRYAPASLLAFVLSSRKSAARPFHRPHVPIYPSSSRTETDPVMDFLKAIILNVGKRCHQPFYLLVFASSRSSLFQLSSLCSSGSRDSQPPEAASPHFPPLSSDTSPTHCYKLLIQYDAFILDRKCATGSFLYRV